MERELLVDKEKTVFLRGSICPTFPKWEKNDRWRRLTMEAGKMGSRVQFKESSVPKDGC